MNVQQATQEIERRTVSGYLMLFIGLALIIGSLFLLRGLGGITLVLFIAAELIGILILTGLYMLQPNEAALLLLFGDYKGTDRAMGLRWANPFYKKKKISLRAHNLNSEKIKVNDKRGNPIEIAAAIVWRVHDTAQAAFDVEDYETYVEVQSEAAIRHLANSYNYDEDEDTHSERSEVTLRSGMDEVAFALKRELQARIDKAGVAIEDAKLTHLAYAPEIAGVMLRRQQAEAIIAARQKIVHGAVSMVEMALKGLSERQVVELDDERKASMVSNLLVVLCSESDVQPVVNTGTLYA